MRHLRRWRRRWLDRRRVVIVPNGKVTLGGRQRHLTAPRVVAIEPMQDVNASRDAVLAQASGQARRVRRGWRKALYRVDEPLHGRTASGHWLRGDSDVELVLVAIALVPHRGDSDVELVLVAIALVPHPGFPVW